MPVAENGIAAANDFEKAMSAPDGRKDLTAVIHEINELRNNREFMAAFNQQIHDGKTDVAGLEGFELTGVDREGDLRFSNAYGVRCEVKPDGSRVEQWGKEKNDREFTINNDDQTAKYKVKSGDTVWSIAKDVCREREGGAEPTNAEVAAEVKRIQEANAANLHDINKIKPDLDIIIPAESVKEIDQAHTKERKTEMAQTVKKELLDDLDGNGQNLFKRVAGADGKVTAEEIDSYIEGHKELSTEQVRALEILKNKLERIQSRREDKNDKSGVSEKEVKDWVDRKIERNKIERSKKAA